MVGKFIESGIKSGIKKGIKKKLSTYRQTNASKAAQVTNYIKARKKDGVSHDVAKAEAYKKFNVKNRPDPGMMKELGNWKPDLTKRVKGGKITYKMTGGQVVDAGHD